MNVIKWIRGWFRSPADLPIRSASQQAAYEAYVRVKNEAESISHKWVRERKLAKLNKDLDDCKKRLEAAVKAKKKSSDIRKEYEGLRTEVLREEAKV